MTSLADQIAATRDVDLLDRIVAAAQQRGIPGARQWAEQHRGELVSRVVTDEGDSLSSVLAYARAQKGLPAGMDPTFVTDELVVAAVDAINDTPAG